MIPRSLMLGFSNLENWKELSEAYSIKSNGKQKEHQEYACYLMSDGDLFLKKINGYYDTVINLSKGNNRLILCNQIS